MQSSAVTGWGTMRYIANISSSSLFLSREFSFPVMTVGMATTKVSLYLSSSSWVNCSTYRIIHQNFTKKSTKILNWLKIWPKKLCCCYHLQKPFPGLCYSVTLFQFYLQCVLNLVVYDNEEFIYNKRVLLSCGNVTPVGKAALERILKAAMFASGEWRLEERWSSLCTASVRVIKVPRYWLQNSLTTDFWCYCMPWLIWDFDGVNGNLGWIIVGCSRVLMSEWFSWIFSLWVFVNTSSTVTLNLSPINLNMIRMSDHSKQSDWTINTAYNYICFRQCFGVKCY